MSNSHQFLIFFCVFSFMTEGCKCTPCRRSQLGCFKTFVSPEADFSAPLNYFSILFSILFLIIYIIHQKSTFRRLIPYFFRVWKVSEGNPMWHSSLSVLWIKRYSKLSSLIGLPHQYQLNSLISPSPKITSILLIHQIF